MLEYTIEGTYEALEFWHDRSVSLETERDEARRLAEEFRNWAYAPNWHEGGGVLDRPSHKLPWEGDNDK